jgi:hypothetical protein
VRRPTTLLALALCACGRPPAPETPAEAAARDAREREAAAGEERVQVTLLRTFRDSTAYGGRRAVYLIRDTATGTEFIGVSGVGVAETGSHAERSGEQTVTVEDER